MQLTRRQLIKGFAAARTATYLTGPAALAKPPRHRDFTDFTVIPPSDADVLQLPDGYVADLLITYGDEFGDGRRFGYNCDFTAYFPLRGADEGILWVNHEYAIPYYITDWRQSQDPTWDPRIEPYRTELDAPIDPSSYTSWWPDGDRGAGRNSGKPRPTVVAIRKP